MIGMKNTVTKDTKAYLKNSDGFCFPLSSAKQTSIGREGCDILIQVNTVDPQHAIVEFNEREECYVLTDLNTINGTFVNDVIVHNAAVRLAPRDIIRFGAKETPYEFYICSNLQMSCSRASPFQRPTWSQQMKLSNNQQTLSPSSFSAPTLPQLSSSPFHSHQDQLGSIMAWAPSVTGTAFTSHVVSNNSASGAGIATNMNSTNVTGLVQTPLPQPPDQVRPAINGHPQRINWERVPSIQKVYTERPSASQTNNWVSNFFTPSKVRGNSPELNASYTILPAGDIVFDDKDKKIASLTSEVNHLKSLEEELHHEQELRNQLEEKLKQIKSESSSVPDFANGQLKEEIEDKTNQLISIQTELDKVKKDKNITVGLVTQMQKDLSNKDSTISKLSREVETLKRNIWDQENTVETLTSKLTKMREGIKKFEENESREKELIIVRQKLKVAEGKQKQQEEFMTSQNEEINKLKQSLSDEREEKKKIQANLGQIRFELDDITRAERMVRVDMEQTTKQMERFHNRVLQVAFSLPGQVLPQKEVSDDELIEILKKMAQTQDKVDETIKTMEGKVKEAQQQKEELIVKSNHLNTQVLQLLTQLESNGLRSASLKKEMELFESVIVEEPFSWVKTHFLKLLKTQMNWQLKIESSLKKCGINVKVSTSEPSEHIDWLQNKWSVALEENEQLKKRMIKSDEDHKNELKIALENKEKETVERIKEAVEKTLREGKENLAKTTEEIQNLEAEKQAEAVKKEKEKIEELNVTVDKLKQLINEKDKETQDKLEEANKVLREMEDLKISSSQLEKKVEESKEEIEMQVEQNKLQLQTEKNNREKEILTYKEQIKQHSITICSLEEKVAKITKAHKKSTDQIVTLEKKLHESRTQLPAKQSPPPPPPPLQPKPKVIVQKPPPDLLARDQLITVLRKEALELKQQLQEKEEVIIGLRKDLIGTSARLSDIKGELSEESKKRLEHSKHSINMQQREMNDLRQKLAALSKVIEDKKGHIERLQTDLEHEKGSSSAFKKTNEDLSQQIELLERFVDQEKQERYKIDDINEQENEYASELADLGAQCRGERHEQVINRQREALAELRKKLKTLEQQKFHNGSKSLRYQAKEISDLTEFYSFDKNNSATTSLPINKSQSLGCNPEAEMERSAHKETADALEASEISFLYMLRQLLASLEVDDGTGLRSLAHIPTDERSHILQARKQTCENLVQEIKRLQNKSNQKEKLLKNYEEDLAKMRKAEDLACRKSAETDLLAEDLINKKEETELLRESLNRTTSRLQQEKRLNNAIKQKKTFHLENERAHIGVQSTPHFCIQDRSISKFATGQKNISRELVRCKDSHLKSRKALMQKGRLERCYSDIGPSTPPLKPSTPKPRHSEKT